MRNWFRGLKLNQKFTVTTLIFIFIPLFGMMCFGFRSIKRIPIDVHNVSRDASLFIDKIELVPLETNDSSLLHKYRKVMYDKETDVYAVYTREQVIFTFSEIGRAHV